MESKKTQEFYEVTTREGGQIPGAPVIAIDRELRKTSEGITSIIEALKVLSTPGKKTETRQFSIQEFCSDIGLPEDLFDGMMIGPYQIETLYTSAYKIREKQNKEPQSNIQIVMESSIKNTMSDMYRILIEGIKFYIEESKKPKPDQKEIDKVMRRLKVAINSRASLQEMAITYLKPEDSDKINQNENLNLAGLTVKEWYQYTRLILGETNPVGKQINSFIYSQSTQALSNHMKQNNLSPEQIRALIAEKSTSPQNQ